MTTYTARTPVDLLALVPFVLGFHPEDSVVLLTFGPGERFHARVDLPLEAEDQQQVAAMLCQVLATHRVEQVAVLVYSEDEAVAESQAEVLLEELFDAGVAIVDTLRVDDECYYPLPDRGEGGTAYDLSTHPFTASEVYEGHRAHDSRAALEDSLIGVDEEDREQVLLAATACADDILDGRGRDWRTDAPAWLREQARWVQRRIRQHLRDHRSLGVQDAGRMLVLVSLTSLRDVAWSEMSRSTAQGEIDLWGDLVRRAPRDLLAPAAALLGFAAWLHGDGALAWCALDRCFEIDPDYAMAQQLQELLVGAVAPSSWSPVPEGQLPVFADPGPQQQAS